MRTMIFAALAASTLLAAANANAAPIVAGQSGVVPTSITPAITEVLGFYNNVAFTSQAPTGQASTFRGTYSAMVFRDSTNNLCATAGQCLTFGIVVNNATGSTDGLETVTTGGFGAGYTYNVGYNNANGGVVPLYVNDTANGILSFNFTSPNNTASMIMPGQSSSYLVIQSSATQFKPTSISFQDSQTATVAGFAPSVPEPATWGMMILGMGMVGTALRRRRDAALKLA